MRILVIDNDLERRSFLKKNLERECFVVDTSGDGLDGSYMGRVHDYDLILLNPDLPRKNGIEVCKDIRGIGKDAPIIILSSDPGIDTKVNFLNAGADDYMIAPYDFNELRSRIRALLRRPKTILLPTLQIDDLVLDTMNQKARRGAKDIYLTRKEFALAEFLMRNIGSIVSRGMLIEHVWDDEINPFSNTIEAHILNLRRKIDQTTKKKLIFTIPGRGYKME